MIVNIDKAHIVFNNNKKTSPVSDYLFEKCCNGDPISIEIGFGYAVAKLQISRVEVIDDETHAWFGFES